MGHYFLDRQYARKGTHTCVRRHEGVGEVDQEEERILFQVLYNYYNLNYCIIDMFFPSFMKENFR